MHLATFCAASGCLAPHPVRMGAFECVLGAEMSISSPF
jgi:hypothetical protein